MRAIHPAPSRHPLELGAKLRSSRQSQGLTLADVSEATGLTKGFLSRLERDETSPSVSTLVTICEVLSLPVGSLFEPPQTQLITLDSAPVINMGGKEAFERLITPRSESRVQLLRSELSVGASGGDVLYTINCEVEVVHVLEGSVTMLFRGEKIELSRGDTLTFSGQEPHSWRNDGDEVAEVIWMLIPAAWSGSA